MAWTFPDTRYLKLLAQIAARQRSRHREFLFRPGLPRHGRFPVHLRARHGGFSARLELRPSTSDLRTFEQIFLRDFYNLAGSERGPELQAAYARLLAQAPPLILDLGANIGLASLYLARQWPGARLLAVEPNPANCVALRRNLRGQRGIEVVGGAVASADGHAVIVNPEAATAGYRTAPAPAEAPDALAAHSVPSLLRRARRAGPCLPWLVKIDIEGAEGELFSQNLDWVGQFPVLIIEPHDWARPHQHTARNFLRLLTEQDREILVLGESLVGLALPPDGAAAAPFPAV